MTLNDLLEAVPSGAYTLHLLPGQKPAFRTNAGWEYAKAEPLTGKEIARLTIPYLPEPAQTNFESGVSQWAETVLSSPETLDCYLCVFRAQGQTAALVRLLLPQAPTIAQIGGDTAPVLEQVVGQTRGLVVFSGPHASGKGTTAFAVLEAIAASRNNRVFLFEAVPSYRIDTQFTTRWIIGQDAGSYEEAAWRVQKCDANTVYFADLPDREAVRCALFLAQSHLVIANGSAESVADCVSDLTAPFAAGNTGILQKLSRTLIAAFNQRILPRADAPGRAALYEVLWADDPGVRDALQNGRINDLEALMETGTNCQTQAGALAVLQKSGIISNETARSVRLN